jgi:hypothetical protein
MMLALKLGRTLEELGRTMSYAEFALWQALYDKDHWGELRADERAGIVAATVANYAGKQRASGVEPALPRDFMPHAPPDEDEHEVEPDPVAFFSAVASQRR